MTPWDRLVLCLNYLATMVLLLVLVVMGVKVKLL
jgi:hypothetical protein